MKFRFPLAAALAALTIVCVADASDPDNPDPSFGPAVNGEGLLVLDWTDLLPEGEEERLIQIYEDFYTGLDARFGGSDLGGLGAIAEGSALDSMPQLGTFNTVESLNGKRIELPGFVVPLDFKGRAHSTFLIVPYFGACIHTPPPAPNQIVFATAEPAQELGNIFYPLWFTGVLETNRQDTDLGNTAYTLRLESVRPYE
ncbi:MAG: DUF3299 domain-containing protein [Pseudomonadota bacterium]